MNSDGGTRDGSENLLPGADLLEEGLADLRANRDTESALLVLVFEPRLRGLGICVPERSSDRPFEHLLYEKIEDRLGAAAHSCYNALIRRMVSYARAKERESHR
jgi:hypothetical protein